jgi:ElaB/YqjD/DUF883 family membrane-anchored ribosome-binding protein
MEKNLLTYTEFRKIYEDMGDTVNSDLEVRKREIGERLKEFSSKKGSLNSIFSRDVKTWEDEAAKLIKSNPYLAIWWRIVKIQNQMVTMKKTPVSDDPRDAKRNQEKLQELNSDLNNLKKEMTEKQSDDMKLMRL